MQISKQTKDLQHLSLLDRTDARLNQMYEIEKTLNELRASQMLSPQAMKMVHDSSQSDIQKIAVQVAADGERATEYALNTSTIRTYPITRSAILNLVLQNERRASAPAASAKFGNGIETFAALSRR